MDVVIVGAGVAGLSTAWRALQRGLSVTLIDPAPASKASRVAAGLLPPTGEMLVGKEAMTRLCYASRDRYPDFAAELEAASGRSTGFRRDGVLDVAFDAQGLATVDRYQQLADEAGIRYERLDADGCRGLEPYLADTVLGGLYSPDDGCIDPRLLTAALIEAVTRLGGKFVRRQAIELLPELPGVRVDNGDVVRGDKVVLAAGAWTHLMPGTPPGLVPEIKPLKGQVLRLRSVRATLHRTVRGMFGGRAVYFAPRNDNEFSVGATYEEAGYDQTTTADAVAELLDRVKHVLPDLGRLEFVEVSAGLRPGSPDENPVLGPTTQPNILIATGTFRVGIQLTAVLGDVMAETLETGKLPELAEPFSPTRFVLV